MGARQSIAQKGLRAIDARNSQLENGSNATKTSVRAPGLSADEREHWFLCDPRGPKDQKNSRFRSRLKISIENEIFERATHRGPIFCGGNRGIEIKNFELKDQKFRSRLKISIESKFF